MHRIQEKAYLMTVALPNEPVIAESTTTNSGDVTLEYSDLVNPKTYASDDLLHPLLTKMRRDDPVVWIETPDHAPFWAITKHADIIEISRANDQFLNAPRVVLATRERDAEIAERQAQQPTRTLVELDGEEHIDLRDIAKDWFLPQSLNRFQSEVRTIAKETVDHMLSLGEECDFVTDVAVWYPLRVIMHILGIPVDKDQMMLTLTQQMFGAQDPDIAKQMTEEERMQMFMDFYGYCMTIVAERREVPEQDLASVLANGKLNGERLSDMDILGYFLITASAGHDTTSSSTAGAILALLENPDEFRKVRENHDLIPTMVDESVRWVTPVKHFMRTAVNDYELRGRTIKAGESVMLLYPSGNRDEEVFDGPFEFRADRRPNRHLAFGHGAHHCLGNLLAKMEMKVLYEELFDRVADIELNGEPRLIESSFVSGLKTLPVRIKAA